MANVFIFAALVSFHFEGLSAESWIITVKASGENLSATRLVRDPIECSGNYNKKKSLLTPQHLQILCE